jgi:hypothetical protein
MSPSCSTTSMITREPPSEPGILRLQEMTGDGWNGPLVGIVWPRRGHGLLPVGVGLWPGSPLSRIAVLSGQQEFEVLVFGEMGEVLGVEPRKRQVAHQEKDGAGRRGEVGAARCPRGSSP